MDVSLFCMRAQEITSHLGMTQLYNEGEGHRSICSLIGETKLIFNAFSYIQPIFQHKLINYPEHSNK